MTATDELRHLLDERGVEHTDYLDATEWRYGDTTFVASGPFVAGGVNLDGKLVIRQCLTPEQVIAATLGSFSCTNDERTGDELGRGTCHEVVDESVDWYMTKCSECGFTLAVEQYGPSNFCPNCGRRVVE